MKIRTTIRAVLFVLALATVLSAFTACNGSEGRPTETTGATENGAITEEDGYIYEPPSVKYNNEPFRIYTWSGTNEWIMETNANSSPIDSMTYSHLMNVEYETGVVFEIAAQVSGGYGAHTDFITKVSTLSGSDDIDLICQYSLAAIHGAIQGLYVDLAQQPDIRWDAPYWSSDFVDTNTFNGQVYYTTGEMTRTSLYNMFVMTFNYDLAVDYNIGNVYEMVEDGEWTVDRLYELSKNVYVDKNNNNAHDAGDLFGLVCNVYNSLDSYQAGCNLPSLVTNDMEELDINPELAGERGVGVVDKLRQLFHENNGAYCNTKDIPQYYAMELGNSLFEVVMAERIISTINPAGINYGVLPMPKYNAEQKDYYTCLGMVYSVFAIPTAADNPQMSSIVMDSMAHDGYSSLTPYIFENALKSRYSKREEDAKMFDYLREGVSYEPGRVLDTVDIFSLIRRSVRDNNGITVYYQENINKFQGALEEINFSFS